jgi:lysophospholipase L1-like esterase
MKFSIVAALCLGIGIGYLGPRIVRALLPKVPAFTKADLEAYDRSVDAIRGIWRLSKISPRIVMVGDSITAAADWRELTGCHSVVNRAIGGDYTPSVLRRLPDILAMRPQAVFLLIGVNDLHIGRSPAETAQDVTQIASLLSAEVPAVYVSEILPVSSSYRGTITNAKIAATNAALRQSIPHLSSLAGGGVTLIDLGVSGDELAEDGLHLSSEGYAKWRDRIAPLVARHC